MVYSVRGLRGLFVGRNAKAVNMLIDPLGRYDFLFSEGHFDLLLDKVYEDFAMSLGSILLLLSLVLSFPANSCNVCVLQGIEPCCLALLVVGTVVLGCVIGLCTLPCLRKQAIKHSAREFEARACENIQRGLYSKKSMEKLLRNWFSRKVGREPVLDCEPVQKE